MPHFSNHLTNLISGESECLCKLQQSNRENGTLKIMITHTKIWWMHAVVFKMRKCSSNIHFLHFSGYCPASETYDKYLVGKPRNTFSENYVAFLVHKTKNVTWKNPQNENNFLMDKWFFFMGPSFLMDTFNTRPDSDQCNQHCLRNKTIIRHCGEGITGMLR